MSDGKVVIDSTLNDRGIKRGIKDIKDRLRGLNVALLKTTAIAAGLSLIGGALTSAVPMIAALTAGILGLSSAVAAAGVGFLGYGAVAVGVLGDVFTATDETYGNLSEHQKEAYNNLKEFKSFWGEFIADFEAPITNTFSLALESLQYVLVALKPAIQGASIAMLSLMESLTNALRAEDVAEIFAYINETAGSQLKALGETVGWLLRGFMNLMVAFAPLANTMTAGLLDMAKAFNDWAISLQSSDKFQAFMDYISVNGPVFMDLIGNLAMLLVGLGTALAPIGTIALDVLNNIIGLFAALLNGEPIDAFVQGLLQSGEQIIQAGAGIIMNLMQGVINNIPLILETVVGMITKIAEMYQQNYPKFLNMGINLIVKLIEGIVSNMPAILNAIFVIVTTIVSTLAKNLPLIIQSGIKILKSLIKGIIQILPQLLKTAIDLIMMIVNTILDNLPMIIDSGIEILLALIDGIIEVLPMLIKAAIELIFKIVDALINHIDEIVAAGFKIVVALIKGILKAVPSLLSMIAKDLIGGILRKLGEVDLYKIGVNIIRGLIRGFKSLNIPTPHFSVSGKLDLNPKGGISIPKIGVDWYKDGGLFAPNSPRLVGMGDASVPEAALPLKPSVLGYIGKKIADTMPMPEGNGGGYQRSASPANITLVLGGTEYDVFVDDISETQDRKKHRLKRK
jgi:phage-related protein